jgi:hypothetical protein
MTPLDLSKQSPRSSHERVDGVAYLARAIDKARAELPGGNLGPYIVLRPDLPTISSLFYYRTGIVHDEFVAAVAAAESEAAVGAWVRGHASDEQLEKWNAQILNTKLSDLPAPALTRVYDAHPAASHMPLETLLIDVFDADDRSMFSA